MRLYLPSGRSLWPIALGAGLIWVELLGRGARNELDDTVGIFALGIVLALCRRAHRTSPLPGVERLTGYIRQGWSVLSRSWFDVGVDLRGTPPIPGRRPPLIIFAVLGAQAAVGGIAALGAVLGADPRWFAGNICSLLYLCGLALLWGALLLVGFAVVFLSYAFIHDAFVSRYSGNSPRSRRREAIFLLSYFLLPALGWIFLPLWVPALLVVGGLLVFLVGICLLRGPELKLLWRGRRGGPIRSCGWQALNVMTALIVTFMILDLLLLARGSAIMGLADASEATLPLVTGALGDIVAWLSGIALITGGTTSAAWIRRRRREDPAQPVPPQVRIEGAATPADRERVRELLKYRQWTVRFDADPPAAHDVRLSLRPSPIPPADRSSRRRWPLAVSLKSLEVPELHELIARRDEVQRRRVLRRGLERLFKRAARHRFKKGTGFWIAPHFWFIEGMTRDVDEDELQNAREQTAVTGIIGPVYRLIFPLPARSHLHRIMTSLEVDIIFVEDGVEFRRFIRVLGCLFDHFDQHGGNQRIEERHCSGLTGIRILIHDFELNKPLEKETYPEPDYEELGRARIFHVFRDRGGGEEDFILPRIRTDIPFRIGSL